jgi:hypothetical protein
MAKKEYSHLVKPLLVQDGPGNLYPKPLVWMELASALRGMHRIFNF